MDLIVREYTDDDFDDVYRIVYESLNYKKNHIKCNIPEVNTPESFNVETSFNKGDDYTNNNFNYTLYDPYVISVEPQMVSTKGNTLLKIHGYNSFRESLVNFCSILYGHFR